MAGTGVLGSVGEGGGARVENSELNSRAAHGQVPVVSEGKPRERKPLMILREHLERKVV